MANATQIASGSVVSLWRYPVKSMMGEDALPDGTTVTSDQSDLNQILSECT